MADSKEVATINSSIPPEFIDEILPSAEKTALLYHLSYLCLGKFPKLENLLRKQAVETQMLFGSSEAVLLKCVGTSDNLAKSLFPILKKAIEKEKATLVVKYLEKAKSWIEDIIRDVDDIVNRYEQHNRSVAACTSDVIQQKKETEDLITQKKAEVKALEESLGKLEDELKKNTQIIEDAERQIQEKNAELRDYIESTSRKSKGLGILAVMVPVVGPIIKSIVDTATVPGESAHIQSLQADVNRLSAEKTNLQNKEWSIQVRLMDLQLKLSTIKIEQGVIPSPVHLNDVQLCLSRIQKILLELQKFWKKVGSLLDMLKKKTLVGDDLVDDMADFKEDFLESIETAGRYWTGFGQCCFRAQGVFSIQSRDAYRFLETDPSTLSLEQWDAEYKSVMTKLNKISPKDPKMVPITEG